VSKRASELLLIERQYNAFSTTENKIEKKVNWKLWPQTHDLYGHTIRRQASLRSGTKCVRKEMN
jgi:hypothetical protein